MKREILFISTIVLLILSSCTKKKDWYCLCTHEGYLGVREHLSGEEYFEKSEEEARQLCADKQYSIRSAQLPVESAVCNIKEQD